ncbi:hypothetical protein GC207_05500 [bacterium]|nr:hypothetical protein [bacterium]
MSIIRIIRSVPAIVLSTGLLAAPLNAADEQSLTDKAKEAVENTKDAVSDAGRAVGDKFDDLWRGIDESRLKNRTPDEIVAWAIMGVLVGAFAGMLTQLKTSGLGRIGRLLLGLAGAFVGGMVVHVAKLDFGWGPVLIRYEDLLFAFLGALLLIVAGRVLRSKSRKQT